MTLKSIQAYLIQAKNFASSQNGLNGRGPSSSPHNPIDSRRFLPFQRGRQKEPAVLLHGNAERASRATKSGVTQEHRLRVALFLQDSIGARDRLTAHEWHFEATPGLPDVQHLGALPEP